MLTKFNALIVEDTDDWQDLFTDMVLRIGWRPVVFDNIFDPIRFIEREGQIFIAAFVDKGGSGAWSGQPDVISHRDGFSVIRTLNKFQPQCLKFLTTAEPWNYGFLEDKSLSLNGFLDKRAGKLGLLENALIRWDKGEDVRFPIILKFDERSRNPEV